MAARVLDVMACHRQSRAMDASGAPETRPGSDRVEDMSAGGQGLGTDGVPGAGDVLGTGGVPGIGGPVGKQEAGSRDTGSLNAAKMDGGAPGRFPLDPDPKGSLDPEGYLDPTGPMGIPAESSFGVLSLQRVLKLLASAGRSHQAWKVCFVTQ